MVGSNSLSTTSSSDDELENDTLVFIMITFIIKNLDVERNSCRTSMLSDHDYIQKVLLENPTRYYECF